MQLFKICSYWYKSKSIELCLCKNCWNILKDIVMSYFIPISKQTTQSIKTSPRQPEGKNPVATSYIFSSWFLVTTRKPQTKSGRCLFRKKVRYQRTRISNCNHVSSLLKQKHVLANLWDPRILETRECSQMLHKWGPTIGIYGICNRDLKTLTYVYWK